MSAGAVFGMIGAGIGYFDARKQQKKMEAAQAQSQKEVDRMRDVYSNLDTSNPFAGMENQFAGMQNQFAGMKNQFAGLENTMEDLTVNQQQFDLERQMFQQSQANIMEGMRGAAGGSGLAATIQALAGQGQIQAQQISASIGQQAADVDRMHRAGAAAVDRATRRGAADVDRMIAMGEQQSQQLEMQKQGELMGLAYGELAANRQSAEQARSQKMDFLSQGISSLGGFFGG